ncbi:uncharacterized protein LOC105252749 isoform X1 [Camponotus floridanus]|uniref:uncharacterized protein LOC105252749 isoform X1 n=1 Tax=Camponotus floridanus TaxID=104421 RepID=UPI000DC69D27|nr:uncharacterized protein LOC105252749 isoform X1 [Camponotus floridanus]
MEDDMFKLCVDCGEYPIDDDHECELPDTNNDDSNLVSSPIETTLTEVQNVEELINEVFKRTPLWDSTLPYEKRGPSRTKLLWSAIDKKLNLRPGTANVKWRNLRDTYVRKLSEQKKYIPSGSAAEAKPKVSWPYFELLGFLRPTVMRRKTFSNISPPASFSTNSDKRYIEQQLEKLNSNTSLTASRSNSNKSCTFSGNRYITSSPNLSDTGASDSSLQGNVDYCNQRKFRADYLPTQQNVNSMIKIEETEISKNIPNSSCKNTAIKNLKMSGMSVIPPILYISQ